MDVEIIVGLLGIFGTIVGTIVGTILTDQREKKRNELKEKKDFDTLIRQINRKFQEIKAYVGIYHDAIEKIPQITKKGDLDIIHSISEITPLFETVFEFEKLCDKTVYFKFETFGLYPNVIYFMPNVRSFKSKLVMDKYAAEIPYSLDLKPNLIKSIEGMEEFLTKIEEAIGKIEENQMKSSTHQSFLYKLMSCRIM